MAKKWHNPVRPARIWRWLCRHRPPLVAGTRWRAMVAIALTLVATGALGAALLLRMSATPPLLGGSPEFVELASLAGVPRPRPTEAITFADGCLSSRCHTAFHTASVVHATTRAGACDICHLPDTGGHTYPIVESVDTLCIDCHGFEQATVQHGALSGDARAGCLACHDAHASPAAGKLLLVGTSVERTCAGCHPMSDSTHRHAPFASGHCDACHEPHGSNSRALLRNSPGSGDHSALPHAPATERGHSDHCRLCHQPTVDAMVAATHSHARMEGDCLACHSPHAAETARREPPRPREAPPRALLTASSPKPSSAAAAPATEPVERCLGCHAGIGRVATDSLVSHDAVLLGRRCIACHAPHASENPAMLWADEASVCLECHSSPVRAVEGGGWREIPAMSLDAHGAALVHGPVSAGQCSACHSVHGGRHARLLEEVNPRVLATPFDARNYALCFSCHDQKLASVDSDATTQFRHGHTNLHRLHLEAGEERSRSCGSCHAVHASSRPRLIAERTAYDGSEWTMAMNFQLTPDGGSCAPGCHAPAQYRRDPAGALARERSAP